MTQRQREDLDLAFWIGVIAIELVLSAWLIYGRGALSTQNFVCRC
jgi:hypothetical protein